VDLVNLCSNFVVYMVWECHRLGVTMSEKVDMDHAKSQTSKRKEFAIK